MRSVQPARLPHALEPTPQEIERQLGHGSRAHSLDRASLVELHRRHRDAPSVRKKRMLWAHLLTTALGTQFEDDDELFFEHTLLVNSAKLIAHAVVGLDMTEVSPAALLSGAVLAEHRITGVVEPDCFDWVVEVSGGEDVIRTLARRLSRFAWATVEHDVLKVLYESLITPTNRKQLGEYYTPDWLAEKLVADTIDDPLNQRVLDPACGSGTFVFHAVRRYLDAATAVGLEAAFVGVTRHVTGMDLHPVAVALARVTYLLAIGRERLMHHARVPVHVPVYLGDSMQWQQPIHESSSDPVDLLIGNPPWLSYRHMPEAMQEQFRAFSQIRGLWQGAKVATHQDLSALFAARSIQLYLRVGGKFAFVMPSAVLDRKQYSGFRCGRFDDPNEVVHVAFSRPWDLRRLRPHFFPRGCAVVFGRRAPASEAMPIDAEVWTGRIATHAASWAELEGDVKRVTTSPTIPDEARQSEYMKRFRQGATVVPRMLFLVERRDTGPIRSMRSPLEKPPWRDLPALEGIVEDEFIMPVYLGEHVLPHRTLAPARGVIAWDRDQSRLFDPEDDLRIQSYPLLTQWWRRVAAVWNEHRSSERLSIAEQLDYHDKLSVQYPIHPIRVVYAKSGMHLCAARIEHRRAIIDHSLYWSCVDGIEEAGYLCAILNTRCVTELVRPFMSYGKDERDIHKHVWKLPIPLFDANAPEHMKLAKLAAQVEAAVAALELDDDLHFAARRRHIREFLAEHPIAEQIEQAVAKLLGQ